MSRVDAAAPDRLPWLSDEPQPRQGKRRRGGLIGWAGAGLVVVAAVGFWAGTRSVEDQPKPSARLTPPASTVRLPAPRPAAPEVRMQAQPEVNPAPAPQVRSAPERQVRIAPQPSSRSAPEKDEKAPAVPEELAKADPAAPVAHAKPEFVMPTPWNPRIAKGAAGRLAQIGAFGSIRQAKQGWWHMARAYPAMRRLPAVVRPSRNSKGRVFYRFQVGTTSQAHSEVLCQRMQRIGFSCAVVDLPGKAKVER